MENLRNEARVNKLFEHLVSREGQSDTCEGEMIRAVCKLGYRFFNDGDKYFEGCGIESSAGNAHAYLVSKSILCVPLLKMFQEHCDFMPDNEYVKGLEIITDYICDYVETQINNNTLHKNDCDMLDCAPMFDDEDDDLYED